eukprot:g1187.t1
MEGAIVDLRLATTEEAIMGVLEDICAGALLTDETKHIFIQTATALKKRHGDDVWTKDVANKFRGCLELLADRNAAQEEGKDTDHAAGDSERITFAMDNRTAEKAGLMEGLDESGTLAFSKGMNAKVLSVKDGQYFDTVEYPSLFAPVCAVKGFEKGKHGDNAATNAKIMNDAAESDSDEICDDDKR